MAHSITISIMSLLACFICILIFNAMQQRRIRLTLEPCSRSNEDFIALTKERLERFQTGLRFRTVSYDTGAQNTDQLSGLINFIFRSFPLVHSGDKGVQHHVINNYSLLYKIHGSDSTLLPALIASHLDVVPTDGQNWTKPHFEAELAEDGFIYARGAIDDKNGVFGILEAIEFLLSRNWRPSRTFYIAFGHDEELRGHHGAARIAEHLRVVEKVQKLEFVSDEGLLVVDGLVPGLNVPAILVGVSEKGFASVRLSYNSSSTAGHSSMPPAESVIGVLAKAVARLEASPQPSQLGRGSEKALLELLANHLTLPFPANTLARLVLNNMWLFRPLISYAMSLRPSTNALIRTTTAVTMFNAGIKQNVLANSAQAIVNHRIHPAQSIHQVLEHDRQAIADPRVLVELMESFEASPEAEWGENSYSFQVIAGTAKQIFPNGCVLPSILVANTDTYHYLQFTSNVYRFSPTHIHLSDAGRFHGADERISPAMYEKAINFYYHLLRNADLNPEQVLGRVESKSEL